MHSMELNGAPVWQWDHDRSMVTVGIDTVCFAFDGSDEALTVTSMEGVAAIPNQLLTQSGTLLCWGSHDGRVVASTSFVVVPRPKPSDYAYSPTEVDTVASIKEWVKERIAEIEASGGLKVGHGLKVVDGALTVDTAGDAEPDNTLPISSAAVYVELGNIDALLATI